jgi:hypothetical protein
MNDPEYTAPLQASEVLCRSTLYLHQHRDESKEELQSYYLTDEDMEEITKEWPT